MNILKVDKGLNLQFDSEMAKVNTRVMFCSNRQEEVKKQIKARNWANPYLAPCGREISKISVYNTT